MNAYQEFLSNPEYRTIHFMLQINDDSEEFTREGFIGNCLLRRTAQKFIDTYNMQSTALVHVMEQIAFETCRNLVHHLLEENVRYREQLSNLSWQINADRQGGA